MEIPSGRDVIQNNCPDWWVEGCGCDVCCEGVADGLELVTPTVEALASAVWCLGSPLAFPLVFCFEPEDPSAGDGGWSLPMVEAPVRAPCRCLLLTLCLPCGQWEVRRRVLDGDMSRYRLWQGYHDGPHCLARYCEGAPITIESGSYGETDCPHLFLCAEVWLLSAGGPTCAPCCAFDVSRRYLKENRPYPLGLDPTESRHERCIGFFQEILTQVATAAFCCRTAGCLVGTCAPDGEGAQEFSGAAHRSGRACGNLARTLFRGIWATRLIAIGCMSTQMVYECDHGPKPANLTTQEEIEDVLADSTPPPSTTTHRTRTVLMQEDKEGIRLVPLAKTLEPTTHAEVMDRVEN